MHFLGENSQIRCEGIILLFSMLAIIFGITLAMIVLLVSSVCPLLTSGLFLPEAGRLGPKAHDWPTIGSDWIPDVQFPYFLFAAILSYFSRFLLSNSF